MSGDKGPGPRTVSADEALGHIRSGSRIFLGSGCAVPQTLVEGLSRQAHRLRDVQLCSLLTFGTADYAGDRFLRHFRHNAFFIGANVRAAVREGRADYTPIFLSEIPALFRTGRMVIDVALISVSPPDQHGYCSYGVSTDIVIPSLFNTDAFGEANHPYSLPTQSIPSFSVIFIMC